MDMGWYNKGDEVIIMILGASEINYCKSILQLRLSVLGRWRDLQYIFAVVYEYT